MAAPAVVAEARVPFRTKFYFGFGSIAEGTKNTAFNVFLLFYYNQVLGLPGTLSGAAIFLALCVDAITDPLIGSISDNFHSRWGRRHPFMYVAALPMALFFLALFNPPAGLGHTGLFLWLTAFAVGVRASMTLYAIPSASMLPEITSHYDERTSLVSYRMLFGWAGGLTMSLLGYLYFFAANGEQDGRLNPEAYGAFAAIGAVLMFVAILVCSLGTHRLIPTLRDPPDKTPFTLKRFVREARDVASDRSYRMIVLGALFASVAGGFNEVVGLYVNTYFWEFSTDQIAIMVFALSLSILMAVALTRPLTERFDKRTSLLGLATFSVFFGPAPVFLRLVELMPPNGHPALLPILLVHGVIVVTAVISIVIIVSSMVADTVEQNELRTGKRQEGMAISAIAFTTKATSGIGGLLAGIALDVIAFPRLAEPGSVPSDKVFLLGLAIGPGMMGLYLIMLYFFSRYRITREGHHDTLRALEARQLAAEAAEAPVDRAAS